MEPFHPMKLRSKQREEDAKLTEKQRQMALKSIFILILSRMDAIWF